MIIKIKDVYTNRQISTITCSDVMGFGIQVRDVLNNIPYNGGYICIQVLNRGIHYPSGNMMLCCNIIGERYETSESF